MRHNGLETFIVSHHPAKFCSHRHCGNRDFSFSLDLKRPRNLRVIRFYGWDRFTLQSPNSGGHSYCSSGDVMVLIVEKQDSLCPSLNLLLFIS